MWWLPLPVEGATCAPCHVLPQHLSRARITINKASPFCASAAWPAPRIISIRFASQRFAAAGTNDAGTAALPEASSSYRNKTSSLYAVGTYCGEATCGKQQQFWLRSSSRRLFAFHASFFGLQQGVSCVERGSWAAKHANRAAQQGRKSQPAYLCRPGFRSSHLPIPGPRVLRLTPMATFLWFVRRLNSTARQQHLPRHRCFHVGTPAQDLCCLSAFLYVQFLIHPRRSRDGLACMHAPTHYMHETFVVLTPCTPQQW